MESESTGTGQAPDPVTPSAAGQAPAAASAPTQDAGAPEANEVKELRAEAAKWRTQLREAQAALKEAQALAGSNTELAQKVGALEAQVAEKAAAADAAQKAAQLTRLAVKAGVDPDVAALLDLSKVDLSDEKKALEVLGKLAPRTGTQARPAGNGNAENDVRAWYQGRTGKQSTIFGG